MTQQEKIILSKKLKRRFKITKDDIVKCRCKKYEIELFSQALRISFADAAEIVDFIMN